jgi:hypothetical protein
VSDFYTYLAKSTPTVKTVCRELIIIICKVLTYPFWIPRWYYLIDPYLEGMDDEYALLILLLVGFPIVTLLGLTRSGIMLYTQSYAIIMYILSLFLIGIVNARYLVWRKEKVE